MHSIDLHGKTALVTGASQGIGSQIARMLHGAGARVALNHPDVGSTADDAAALAAELNAARADSALVAVADIGDAAAVQAMMATVQEGSGGLDLLVNNAAILRDHTVAKMTLDEWQSVIDIDLTGTFHCCKYGLEIMRDGGAIVSLASISALHGFFGQANYAAAKGGVIAMTKVLAREVARRGIRVNAVAPGVIETAMTASIPDAVRAEMLKNVPLGRLGTPDEVAGVVLFLCSPLAAYVTGQTIEINGGWRG